MKKIIILVLVYVTYACASQQEKVSESAILISNVNIVDVRTGNIIENRQVVVDSGKISRILESISNAENYKITIDGTGKFLMPGLAEMHAHIPTLRI